MKKTTIVANYLFAFIKGFIKEDKVDLQKNYEQIMRLFDESNFIKTNPQERMKLLKMVSGSVRARLTNELEQAKTDVKDILEFEKEPYISKAKEPEQRNYDFLAMHNIEFIRDEN